MAKAPEKTISETPKPSVQPTETPIPEKEDNQVSKKGPEPMGTGSEEDSNPTETKEKDIPPASQKPETKPEEEQPKIELPNQVSGLSLQSIRAKKQHRAKQLAASKISAKEQVHEEFTENQLLLAWDTYTKRMKKKGKKILASILASDRPVADGTIIRIELPNDTMKKDVEYEQGSLMAYLKKELKNTDLTLEIKVNKEVAKKYAFTPIEKYNKLKEKNPLIDQLKNKFDLDI